MTCVGGAHNASRDDTQQLAGPLGGLHVPALKGVIENVIERWVIVSYYLQALLANPPSVFLSVFADK